MLTKQSHDGQISESKNVKVPQMVRKAVKNTKEEKKILFLLLQNLFFSKSIQGEFFISILSNILPNHFKYYYIVRHGDSPASFDAICLCNGVLDLPFTYLT